MENTSRGGIAPGGVPEPGLSGAIGASEAGGPATGPLTAEEHAKLDAYESVIDRGLRTFVAVGEALAAIREQRLYREWGTFEQYCARRFALRRRHAYRLIQAAKIVQNLRMCPIGHIPANEAQARPLARLDSPAEQIAAWAEVVELARGRGVTAEQVRAVVERRALVGERRSDRQPTPPLPPGRFSVILADPPWRYQVVRNLSRAVENHYPTMSLERICALPVPEIAARDCVLFLWATSPLLPEALVVIAAWQFIYRTSMVWVKNGLGMGDYVRVNHEMLLLGVRGHPGTPEPRHRPASVIQAPRGRHSEKPAVVHQIIEAMYPRATRVELFGRRPRANWIVWGNEVAPELMAAEPPGRDAEEPPVQEELPAGGGSAAHAEAA